ncbi:MFP1 attachment factor 1 [Acorus gramineus]|uniref:MFP1 attachment factor 1 n=1 Tax=Acorus gramineus TaxID=55184 RepID=A0AAV9B0K5_ACOGR|nr:MFP1 attachment factor 1 [Acorus gramineus]
MAEEEPLEQQSPPVQEPHQEEEPSDKERETSTDSQDARLSSEMRKINISLNLWPPTQRTRDAVINRLVETLSVPSSVLSKRYGSLPPDEAAIAARLIEEEAFSGASSSSSADTTAGEDDGIGILQIYSKEISRRMIETVKARAASSSPDASAGATSETVESSDKASGEETSSVVESETSQA